MSDYEGGSFPGGISTLDRPTGDDSLAAFVWTLYDDLEALLGNSALLADITIDAGADPILAAAVAALAAAWPDVLGTRDQLLHAIGDPDNAERLTAAGVAGAELAFKLGFWTWAR